MKKHLTTAAALAAIVSLLITAPAWAATPVVLTGVVEVSEQGDFYLITPDQDYLLDGISDGYEGRTVKLTGSLEEAEDGTPYVLVDSIEEVE